VSRYLRRLTRNQRLAGSAIAAGLLVALAHGHGQPSPAATAAPGGSNEALANSMAAAAPYHWTGPETTCLDKLWARESAGTWSPTVTNPTSGAYGIPQSLPASKMAAAGADWQTNPATQIRWGLGYIAATYGTPCGAWSHEEAANWY
jgi:resuscitation-promoting factor RpfB